MIRWFAILPAVMVLGACAPDISNVPPAVFGPRPEGDLDASARKAVEPILKDPFSAHLRRIGGPDKGWVRVGDKIEYAWVACYLVNARNSFGAYTGWKRYVIIFRPDTTWRLSASAMPANAFVAYAGCF